MTPDAIAEAVHIIRSAPIDRLASPDWVEEALLPQMGFPEPAKAQLPEYLHPFCGTGIGSYQSPNQFSKYLCYLSYQNISTYLEIGTFRGGTFIITVEYLSRFHPVTLALAVDRSIQESVAHYATTNPCVQTLEGRTRDPGVLALLQARTWDLVLVDANHTLEGCWRDYTTVRDNARIIALHDTYNDRCPGVGDAWLRIKDSIPARYLREFHEQYPELQGTERYFGIALVDWSAPAYVTTRGAATSPLVKGGRPTKASHIIAVYRRLMPRDTDTIRFEYRLPDPEDTYEIYFDDNQYLIMPLANLPKNQPPNWQDYSSHDLMSWPPPGQRMMNWQNDLPDRIRAYIDQIA